MSTVLVLRGSIMDPAGSMPEMNDAEFGKVNFGPRSIEKVDSQTPKKEVKSNEDSGRGETWSEQDTRHLIGVWADPNIQTKLKGFLRNNTVYDEICRRLKEFGVHRTPAQCRNKTKNLRKGFRQLKLRSGHCSKSITRQSSIFFKELDRVWGQDFLNSTSEFEAQDGPDIRNPPDCNQIYENAELCDGCSADGGDMSDYNEPTGYEMQGDETKTEDPNKECASNVYMYPGPISGYTDRDRVGSMMGALQQANQENMENIRETVIDLNRTFLEQQAAAEERREKLSREHEIRLFEMFLNRSGKTNHPSNYAQSPLGHPEPMSHNQEPTDQPSSHEQSSSSVRASEACGSYLRCLSLRLHPGDDIKDCLGRLVEERGIQAACIVSCVGSIRCANLRLADSKTILKVASNHEIVSLVGTLSADGMHLHASLSNGEGKVVGGHVVGNMEVFTTAEIVIGELPSIVFKREMDKDTGYRELVVKQDGEMS